MSHFVMQDNKDGTITFQQKQVQKQLAEISGKVKTINYKNNKIFSIHAEKMNKDFRCVLIYKNPFCPVRVGDAVFGVAEYIQDTRYGPTLNIIQSPFVIIGDDKNTIIKSFMTALKGTGFGSFKAHSLVNTLMERRKTLTDSIKKLDELASLYNYENETDLGPLIPYTMVLKEKQMLKLLKWWYKYRNTRKLWLFGMNNTEIKKCRMDPNTIYKLCLENPYKISGLKLEKCEEIMNRMGKTPDPLMRECAQVYRKVDEFMDSCGWIGVPSNILVNKFPQFKNWDMLREQFNIKTELHTVYMTYGHEVEVGICDLITNLINMPTLPNALHENEIQYTREDLSDEQKTVIHKALNDNICVIKGGGGSGKTTAIKEIIHNLDLNNIKYRIVSFTGKAVARIREVTGKKDPMTMHMSISNYKKSKSDFTHLVIDETSMVTSELLYEFVQKYNQDYRITMIGDPNQLTPIGFGTLFDQVIKSGVVPTYTLYNNHRVSGGMSSGILINANNIIEHSDPGYNGPPFEFEETGDFTILDGDLSTIKLLVEGLRDSGIRNDKITIICPYNKYLIDINKICQNMYNDMAKSARDQNGALWKINDRIMMTQNNYNINVMNGDEGRITDLTASEIKITFKDGKSYVFDLTWDDNQGIEDGPKTLTSQNIAHSFGVSVHRYQGSENDYVIFYIPESKPSKFLNRNLLYTGITRAKKILWMVGDYNTMIRCVETAPAYRCDNLAQRLKMALE